MVPFGFKRFGGVSPRFPIACRQALVLDLAHEQAPGHNHHDYPIPEGMRDGGLMAIGAIIG